jgi:hypothetical protein
MFLLSKIGQDWDKIYSEVISRLPTENPIWNLMVDDKDKDKGYTYCGESSIYSTLYVDENNKLQLVNPNLKNKVWQKQHCNVMLNMLLLNLIVVKKANYVLDLFIPESVKIRSQAYLQKSFDIHNMFQHMFEVRCDENTEYYQNWKGVANDEDWTLPKIAQAIRKSSDFYELPKKKQKEFTAENIEEFFKKNNYYKPSVYSDPNKHALKLRNWRLKPRTDEDEE